MKDLSALTKKELIDLIIKNQKQEPQAVKVHYRRDKYDRLERTCPACGDIVCVSKAARINEHYCRKCGVKFAEE